MTVYFVVDVVIGLVLGLANIVVVRKLMPRGEQRAWGIGLIIAALIYVGFLFNGAEGDWFWIEPAGVLLYGAVAIVGMTFAPVAVGIGWLLHAFWDLGLHRGEDAHFVPEWYPGACLGYDLILGVYLLTRTKAWAEQNTTREGAEEETA